MHGALVQLCIHSHIRKVWHLIFGLPALEGVGQIFFAVFWPIKDTINCLQKNLISPHVASAKCWNHFLKYWDLSHGLRTLQLQNLIWCRAQKWMWNRSTNESSVLARHTGQEESEAVHHLWGRLAILLQRGNAAILGNRIPNFPPPQVDGLHQ